ncbi:MAG TPA: hypothetical protein ENN11_01130, partial [Methanomicrobia archaeon]|nr:hypothetical protein [Methanomicrobia archaeon]
MKKANIVVMILMVSLFAVLPASVSADQYVSPGDDIQAAVDDAAANGGTVYFAPGTYEVNIFIGNPNASFTLSGAGAGVSTLDGNDNGSVIRIEYTGDAVVTVEGFTITDGVGQTCIYYDTSLCGGGMYLYSANAVVNACVFTDNYADDYGGGLYSYGSQVIVTGSTFHKNIADSYGGGMDINESSLVVDNCVFSENDGGTYAGGLDCYYSKATVTNSTFEKNIADSYGGGVYVYSTYAEGELDNLSASSTDLTKVGHARVATNGTTVDATVAFSNCTFEDNYAGTDGGGMYCTYANDVYVESTIFDSNTSQNYGGGICFDRSEAEITGCTFDSNTAKNHGAGMYNNDSDVTSISCLFTGNETDDGYGGGMYNNDADANVDNCTFSGNTAERGGGMYNSYNSAPIVTDCLFSYNVAYRRGGGMDNHENSAPVVTNCVFVGNEVIGESTTSEGTYSKINGMTSAGGGGMFSGSTATPVVTNCTFTLNTVPYYSNKGGYDGENGGGVKNANNSSGVFTNCIVWGNYPNDVLNTDGNVSTFEYSNVGGGFPGEGNIDADPLFVNAPTDVSLQQGSPCIDAGTDMSPDVVDDILGVARPQGSAYDMGAYEFAIAASNWSPVSIMPLARTQLATALEAWGGLLGQLPEEPTEEMTELIERIQAHMQNATGLANPIYASGQLSQA